MESTSSIELGLVENLKDAGDANLATETEQDQDEQLHTAIRRGLTETAIRLLYDGVSATKKNEEGLTPLDTAAKVATRKNMDCFKVVFFVATEIERDKMKRQPDLMKPFNKAAMASNSDIENDPEAWALQLQRAVEELSPVQLYSATVSRVYQQPTHPLWRMLTQLQTTKISKDSELQVAVVKAILDKCVFGDRLVVTNMLEDDIHHNSLPTCKSFIEDPEAHVSSLFYLGSHHNYFLKFASHPTVKAFVASQWRKKRKLFWLQFLYYLFQMVVLTCALAIAARPGLTDAEINTYPAPVDKFRGICEGIAVVIILATIVDEIVEIVYTPWFTYMIDIMNYFQWSTSLLTLMIIPFRIWNHPGQWIVASLAYVLHGLKATEYAALFKATGSYIFTMRIILSGDISRFLLVFMGILATFSGSFYLSLRYDDSAIVFDKNGTLVSGSGLNSDQRNLTGEGKEYYEVLYTGLRSFLETGSVLAYFGSNGGFRALSVVLYLAFLFVVVIILLNVLIAQMTDTYSRASAMAEAVFLRSQCWYLAKLQDQRHAACLPYYFYRLFRHLAIQLCCPKKGCRNARKKDNDSPALNVHVAWVPWKEIPSFEEEMKSKMDELAKQLSDLKSTLEKTAAPGQQQA